MQATAETIQDLKPKNDMPTSDINNLCRTDLFFDIYYRTFTIAISPRGNDFKGIISKVPGGNSYCEGSIIDIQKRIHTALRHTMSLQMAQTRPLNLV